MKRFSLVGLLFLLSFSYAFAQQSAAVDSLLKLVSTMPEYTTKAQLFINIGRQYEESKPDIAKYWYKRSGDLSANLGDQVGVIRYIANYTYVLNMQGRYDSSRALNQQGVDIARKIKDSVWLAKSLFNTGSSFREQGDYLQASAYYDEGKRVFHLIGRDDLMATGEDILQVLYKNMNQYDSAIAYGEKSVAHFRQLHNDPTALGAALNNLGINYIMVRQFEKARKLFEEALDTALANNDLYLQMSTNMNLGDIEMNKEHYSVIEPYYRKALELATELGSVDSRALSLKGLSYYYMQQKQYAKAKQLAEEALSLAQGELYRGPRAGIYTQLGNLAYAMNDPYMGNHYDILSAALQDTILNEHMLQATKDMEYKYATELKVARIHQLEADHHVQVLQLKNKNMTILILSVLSVAVLLLAFLAYRNYRHQRQLQQLRINELETEKQLAATAAVLKGEEQERARMAKDLHDGLGGMLSGVKFSLNTMRGNLVMTADNAQAFERSLDMLDSSIGEMRRIAHNMLPEALIKYGLDTALHGLCRDISASGVLQVRYQSMGLEGLELEQGKAITIYRIIQELLNNTLKHAQAHQAIVQLSRAENQLSITVEDDGIGFDRALLKSTKGMGWANIENRVDFLQGKLDIDTGPGRGTSSLIEIPL